MQLIHVVCGRVVDSTIKLGITDAVAKSVPKPYVVFGLAGALPYLGSSLTTVYLARQAGEAATGKLGRILSH